MKEKAIIESVQKHEKGGVYPTLLKFQNGELATITEDTEYSRFVNDKGQDAARVVIGDQAYEGLIEPATSGGADEEMDLYICVRNKKTNKVKILPIQQALLKNTVYDKLSHKRMDTLSKETTVKKVLKEFGGRSASRYLSRQENLKMDVELFKDDLDATVQDTTINEEAEEQLDDDKNLNVIRPKFNKEAKHVHEVYNVSDVIPQELLDRLDEESKAVFSTKLEKLPIDSEYLKQRISLIQNSTSSVENFLKIKLIIYMDCLLNFITSRARNMKNCELSRISEKVETDVRARFCDPNSKQCMRTALFSEKALCYFIVLALLISDDYEVDVNVLTQDLRSPRRKIVKYAHVVMARMKNKTDVLSLRLPSKVPPLPSLHKRSRI